MDSPPSEQEIAESHLLQKRIIPAVMIGVAVWGSYLAIGAMLHSGAASRRPILKGLIMAGACALFLAFWSLRLRTRAKREEQESE
jgi:hypothetical protein